MSPRLSMNIMLILSVSYGAAVAIVALTASSAVETFAVIGAIVLGVLWAARSFLIRGSR
ncbi:hypothetical protein ABT369_55305 [Dactylosporangium sp. NPDC000244]|uniref:hypothetical protein n=1 Tax=Dactylosporangium sp. NPDC000244 TaxID=3154365 RepID=UPI00331B72F8